jgi:CRP-like cAMP-binding protein
MAIVRETIRRGDRSCRVDRHALRRASLFDHLRQRDLDSVAAATTCRWYKRSEEIASPSDESAVIFLICSGIACLQGMSRNGEAVTLAVLYEGDICGAPFVDPGADADLVLEAMTERTVVYRIPWELVKQLWSSYPEIADEAHRVTLERLRTAYARMKSLRSEPVPIRLRRALKQLAERDPHHVVPLTRQELGTIVGASREEVSRAIGDLDACGLVVTESRGKLVVPDPPKLDPDEG